MSDAEIIDAIRRLATSEGIFVEPSAAAPIAAVPRLIDTGWLGRADRVVAVTTGHGLKDVPDAVLPRMPDPIAPDEVCAGARLSRGVAALWLEGEHGSATKPGPYKMKSPAASLMLPSKWMAKSAFPSPPKAGHVTTEAEEAAVYRYEGASASIAGIEEKSEQVARQLSRDWIISEMVQNLRICMAKVPVRKSTIKNKAERTRPRCQVISTSSTSIVCASVS